MGKPEQPMTATGRSASEIGFVLRRAKWRSGPEVLRDIARAESELQPGPAAEKPRGVATRRGKIVI